MIPLLPLCSCGAFVKYEPICRELIDYEGTLDTGGACLKERDIVCIDVCLSIRNVKIHGQSPVSMISRMKTPRPQTPSFGSF